MSREYVPDCWIVLELGDTNRTIHKVFAGWYGGYTQGDSWKLSSGILEHKDCGEYLEFTNHSGSVYRCYKSNNRMSGYMMGILSGWLKEADEDPKYIVRDVSEMYV